MNFLDVAKRRYTTKQYTPDKKVSDSQIEALKEILRLSPSSINSQPWKFFFISDEKLKRELAGVSYFNEHKINDGSHVVVFTAIDDITLFEEQIKANLPEGAVNYFYQKVKPKGEAAIKAWFRNQVYLSLGFFLSACASLDIDSTPMESIDTEAYDRILGLKGYKTLFGVAIGYRHPEDANQPSSNPKTRLPIDKVIETR